MIVTIAIALRQKPRFSAGFFVEGLQTGAVP
jgi:hypothetical protein